MNPEEKEEKLLRLMRVERGDAFWGVRRRAILAAARGQGKERRIWLLLPAAAAAALLLLTLPDRGSLPPAPPAEAFVSGAFLENLDLLSDMDVLEALSEEDM